MPKSDRPPAFKWSNEFYRSQDYIEDDVTEDSESDTFSSHTTGSSSSTDGYDSVCDDDNSASSVAVVGENCNNSGVGQARLLQRSRVRVQKKTQRWRQFERAQKKRRQIKIGRRHPPSASTNNVGVREQNESRKQQQQQATISTATGTPTAVEKLRSQMDGNIRLAIEELNGTFDSLMRLNASENCCRRKRPKHPDDDETNSEWVTADLSPLSDTDDAFEGYRQTTSELSSCGSASWCPLNVLYDRQHFCPSKKKKRELEREQALIDEAKRRQQRRLMRQQQQQQQMPLAKRLLLELQPPKKRPYYLVMEEPLKATEQKEPEHQANASYLAKRLLGLENLLLTMQENSEDQDDRILLRLKRETAAYHDVLLMLHAKELHNRVQRQHKRLERRWNFRRNWAPIPAATRKMCSAAKDGFVPEGGATCLDRRDRWLLKFMPKRLRGLLPRLLDGVDFDDGEQVGGAGKGAPALVLTKARGRKSNACHNLRDPHEDIIRRYVYAVLS